MKKIFCFLFIIIPVIAFPQNPYKLFKEVIRDVYEEKYESALINALKADSVFVSEELELESNEYASLEMYIGLIYSALNNNAEAEKYYLKAIDDFRSYVDPSESNYQECLNSYAIFLIDNKRYTEAEPFLLEGLEEIEAYLGSDSEDYAYTLTLLGALYNYKGDYSEAETRLTEANEIYSGLKIKGGFSSDYAYTLQTLATVYFNTEKYDLSIGLYTNAVNRYKKAFGEENEDYASALSDLADVYTHLSQFNNAEPLYVKALEAQRSASGERSEYYAYYLSRLADLYRLTGDYEKSETLFRKALKIQESEGFDANSTYFGLSALYQIKADYGMAEEMINKVMASEDLSQDSTGYMYDLNLLANLNTLIGSFDKAENLYIKIASYCERHFGNSCTDYAIDIDNLTNLYLNMGRFVEAEPLALKAMEIKKKNLGEMSPEVAYSLDRLADINSAQGNYDKAESFARQSIEIYRVSCGEQHSDFGSAQKRLAGIFFNQKKYNEAESLLKSVITLFRKKVGENHPLYIYSLWELAVIYELSNRADSSETLIIKVSDNLSYQIRQNFSFMSEREKEQFIEDINIDFSSISSFVFRRKQVNPVLTAIAYNNQLALKGIVLQSSKALRQGVMNSGDRQLTELYDRLSTTKELLTRHEQLPVDQRWLDTDSLADIAATEEKDLMRNLKNLPGYENFSGIGTNYTWQDVCIALGENDAAIEFIAFDSNDLTDTIENTIYCALILRPGMKQPEMVKLFEEKNLEDFLAVNRSTSDAITADNLYRFKNEADRNSDSGKGLREIIWEPLESYLDDVNNIWYSPAGLLNTISFDAIPLTANTCLSDKYKMHAVTSTREVINKNNEVFKPSGNTKAVFYGGINYDSDTMKMKSQQLRYAVSETASRSRFRNPDPSRGSSFMYLEGTLSEVRKIESTLDKYNLVFQTYTGDEATEESFKALDNLNSPAFLHIATHGFFFQEPERLVPGSGTRGSLTEEPYQTSVNPLFRSGLIFAGGNHAWKSQPIPGNVEDGILLAAEVSDMYLPNTQLVVLSACETGLGEIKGSEGVFGLQRAYKMAGVDYLLISLWQVPDYQTSELMNKFYEGWISGIPIHEAFRNAQNFMKSKYPDSPSNWAAFTLIK